MLQALSASRGPGVLGVTHGVHRWGRDSPAVAAEGPGCWETRGCCSVGAGSKAKQTADAKG